MNLDQQSLSDLQQDPAFEFAFRLRTPQPAKPRGLVVLLHGVGSSERSMASLAQAMDPGLLVVLAQAPLNVGSEQFAWFQVAFTAEGPRIVAEEAEQSRQRLIRFVAQLQAAFGLGPERTVIAGFSQGGIMSASVALSAPEGVAGFGLLCGRILPELAPHLAPVSQLSRLRAFVGHGTYDSKLPVEWAYRSRQWLSDLAVPYQLELYPIDHVINRDMQDDFLTWIDLCLGKAMMHD